MGINFAPLRSRLWVFILDIWREHLGKSSQGLIALRAGFLFGSLLNCTPVTQTTGGTMSKVMRAIDAKSFIIGVLSAVVVCVVMGTARIKDEEHIILYFDTK